MARIVRGRIILEVDEFKGETCPKCNGGGGYQQGAQLIRCENKDCAGTGLVNRVVASSVKFSIQPFTYKQKCALVNFQSFESGKLAVDSLRRAGESIRLAVKHVEGLFEDEENKVPYKLQFVDGNQDMGLTEDCLSDLLNTKLTSGLMAGCNVLLTGVPERVEDANGRPVPGARFVFPKASGPN